MCGNVLFASDYVVLISWQYSADERVPRLLHINEVIGSYVTAGARIHLYGFLDKLQEKAIYMDTDCDCHTARAGKNYTNRDE